jgi:hypothetical protein
MLMKTVDFHSVSFAFQTYPCCLWTSALWCLVIFWYSRPATNTFYLCSAQRIDSIFLAMDHAMDTFYLIPLCSFIFLLFCIFFGSTVDGTWSLSRKVLYYLSNVLNPSCFPSRVWHFCTGWPWSDDHLMSDYWRAEITGEPTIPGPHFLHSWKLLFNVSSEKFIYISPLSHSFISLT